MKNNVIKVGRVGITLVMVILAIIAVFKIWGFYTESPWTRDAKFTANVVSIGADVSGLLTDVPVKDNQYVHKGDTLFVIDTLRYQQSLNQAKANVSYYHALVNEKQREAGRRVRLGTNALSQEEIEQSTSSLSVAKQQLAQAESQYEVAKLDLERTVVKAPADGWVTNLNAYVGEFISRGDSMVALVEKDSFYIIAYMEETKLSGVRPGYHVEITPLGSNQILYGKVDSISAGVANSSAQSGSKGLASIDSNLEWVRLAQRVPVKIMLDPADIERHQYPAGTTATIVVTGETRNNADDSLMFQMIRRLREFG